MIRSDDYSDIRENLFGLRKRLRFVAECLARIDARDIEILDVGCGTAEFLTLPLARRGFKIVGQDVHRPSLARAELPASKQGVTTVEFTDAPLDEMRRQFDVVILSEVIEHVRPPGPLLDAIRRRLRPGGHLLITIPNGFGPFELDQVFWKRNFLWVPRAYEAWKRQSESATPGTGAATLNDESPHVNWFTFGEIRRLLSAHGFQVSAFRSRTFVASNYLGLVVGALQRAGLPVE